MILRVSIDRLSVDIDDPCNFRALSIRVEGRFADAAQRADRALR